MALTQGKIKINSIEYDVASLQISFGSQTTADSGQTDDGVNHVGWVYHRIRNIAISLPPATATALSTVLTAVQGQTYSLTYFDPIDGEKTINCYTDASNVELYNGVLYGGLWRGASFVAKQLAGE